MVLHDLLYRKGYKLQERFIRDLWNSLEPLEIPGGPLVVHLDHVENQWAKLKD